MHIRHARECCAQYLRILRGLETALGDFGGERAAQKAWASGMIQRVMTWDKKLEEIRPGSDLPVLQELESHIDGSTPIDAADRNACK